MNRVATTVCLAVLAMGLAGTSGCADPGGSASSESAEGSGAGGNGGSSGESGSGAGGETGGQGGGQNGRQGGGPETGSEPDLVGKGLAIARQRSEEAGFEARAYDSTGRDRTPVLGENWQVCFQEPARQRNGEPTIRLGVVRVSEDCPDEDRSRDQPTLGANNELPDFTGSSLQVATEALGANASVEPVDAGKRDREIYIPQNWRVCDQSPDPGTTWNGEPVTFQVVKYGERCP